MKDSVLLGIVCGLAVFFILLSVSILQYEAGKKKKRFRDDKEWLLSDFSGKVYSAAFGNRNPEELSAKLRINVKEYRRDCEIAGETADLYKIVTHYFLGLLLLITGCTLGIIVNAVFTLLGIICACYLCVLEKRLIHNKAAEKRHQIEMELPRFLDLLRTELNVGLPVETAIYVICERTDTLLAKEFFLALRKMEFGANEWGEAMELIAAKYNVDSLSNFVLNIVTAYRKGVSVANAVEREYKDIHKAYLLNIKDRAEKTKSAALIPMFVLQLFPLITFIALPLFITLMQFM